MFSIKRSIIFWNEVKENLDLNCSERKRERQIERERERQREKERETDREVGEEERDRERLGWGGV